MSVTSPCKDYPDRQPSCHSKCEKYQKFRRELDARNKFIRDCKARDGITSLSREKRNKWG